MLTVKANRTRIWTVSLVQYLVSCFTFLQAVPVPNSTLLVETRYAVPVPDSNLNYTRDESDILIANNGSLFCTSSVISLAGNSPSSNINLTLPAIQNRTKRCVPLDAALQSRKVGTRRQLTDKLKNEKFVGLLKDDKFSRTAFENSNVGEFSSYPPDYHNYFSSDTLISENLQNSSSTSATVEIDRNYNFIRRNQFADYRASSRGPNSEDIFSSSIENNSHHHINSEKNSTYENLPNFSNSEDKTFNSSHDFKPLKHENSIKSKPKISRVSLSGLPIRKNHPEVRNFPRVMDTKARRNLTSPDFITKLRNKNASTNHSVNLKHFGSSRLPEHTQPVLPDYSDKHRNQTFSILSIVENTSLSQIDQNNESLKSFTNADEFYKETPSRVNVAQTAFQIFPRDNLTRSQSQSVVDLMVNNKNDTLAKSRINLFEYLNPAESTKRQNYSIFMTKPTTEILITSQLNPALQKILTQKSEETAEIRPDFEVMNTLVNHKNETNNEFSSTDEQVNQEYGSILAELLRNENMMANNSEEFDIIQKSFEQVTSKVTHVSRPAPIKYKLKHFLGNRNNTLKRDYPRFVNPVSKNEQFTDILSAVPKNTIREFEALTTPTPTPDSPFDEIVITEDWNIATDPEYKTETRERATKNLPSMLHNNEASQDADLLKFNVLRKHHKMLTDEPVPPMNPNENWKSEENRTYYTLEEIRSFFHSKNKQFKDKYKAAPEIIIIDSSGVNETIIKDFCKNNWTSSFQNKTGVHSTGYEVFKLFSNESLYKDCKNESTNTLNLLTYKDVEYSKRVPKNGSAVSKSFSEYRGKNTIESLYPTSQKFETFKLPAHLEENLLNSTIGDEKAIQFFKELLRINETFLTPNFDFDKEELKMVPSKKNVSNIADTLVNILGENAEVTFVNLKDPQAATKLREEHSSARNKIIIIVDSNVDFWNNVQDAFQKKKFVEGKSDSFTIKEIPEKHLVEMKSANSFENGANGENNILSKSRANFLPEIRHHYTTKPVVPHEQFIRKQFNFVDPQIVDNFVDVYKHYIPRHSVSKYETRQQNYGKSNEDDLVSRFSNLRSKPFNFIENLFTEIESLKNSIPLAYASHCNHEPEN